MANLLRKLPITAIYSRECINFIYEILSFTQNDRILKKINKISPLNLILKKIILNDSINSGLKKHMKYHSVFNLISKILKQTKASCILIGEFAINYYKVTRQTVDVDFLITNDDFKKMLVLLKKEGYEQDYIKETFIRLKNNAKNLMDIDFMFVDKTTLDKIIKDGKKIDIANCEFIIPSINHLIAIKLHSIKHNKIRETKDLPDIINLIRYNNINVNDTEFKKLCIKFGTKELYRKILEYV